MKRAKRLYVMSGILAVVCISAFAVIKYDEKQEDIKNSGEVIMNVDTESVNSLSWTCDGESLAFHKDEIWLYDDDETFPVDEDKINSLLEHFREFSAAFIIENVTDYGQYGLDSPLCTINFSDGENDYEVTLGDFSPMDSQRYVSIGDGNVYLVNNDPLDSFDVPLSDMIDNDEVPEFDNTSSITFSGSESYQIVYREYTKDSTYTCCSEDIYFKQEGEELLPLDTSRVESYLNTVSGLFLTDYAAYDVQDDELSAYGLDDPELIVEIQYTPEGESEENVQTFSLSISRDPEEREADETADNTDKEETDETNTDEEDITAYIRAGDSKIVYNITADTYRTLMASGYDDLRHREVFTADFEDVTGMDASLDGAVYSITSEGKGDSKIFYYNEEELEVSALKSALENIRADSFTEETPDQKEELSLTVYLNNKAFPQVQLDFYRYDGEHCLAAIDGKICSLVPRSDVVELIEALNAIIL